MLVNDKYFFVSLFNLSALAHLEQPFSLPHRKVLLDLSRHDAPEGRVPHTSLALVFYSSPPTSSFNGSIILYELLLLPFQISMDPSTFCFESDGPSLWSPYVTPSVFSPEKLFPG